MAVASSLLMVVAKFVLWPKKENKNDSLFTVCRKVILRYLPFYLG